MAFDEDWQDPLEKDKNGLLSPPAAVERRRRRRRKARPLMTWWLIAAGALTIVLAIALLWTLALKAMKRTQEPPTVAVTPTFTQAAETAIPVPAAATPTVQVQPTDTPIPPPTIAAQIAIGGWVQVTGTNDTGLSFRAGPGQENARLKILTDGALLKVLDGPREDGGFTWWRLEEHIGGQPGIIGWTVDAFLVPASAP